MRQLVADYSIVIVTHNMQQAARVSDQTVFFSLNEKRQGILVEASPTTELFTNPRDKRTEDYITVGSDRSRPTDQHDAAELRTSRFSSSAKPSLACPRWLTRRSAARPMRCDFRTCDLAQLVDRRGHRHQPRALADRGAGVADHRDTGADGGRPARDLVGHSHRDRARADGGPRGRECQDRTADRR